jgi:DNA-binding response OmpR family regulator
VAGLLGEPEAEAASRRPAERSILLAEHEPEVAEMSARYLRRDRLAVRLVTSPDPTLAALTAGADAAAVIDLTMPGLDPRRIRRALRTPVIFLVADTRAPRPRGLAVRGDAASGRRWLARPFSPRQLVAVVRDVLAPADDAPGPGRVIVADGRQVPLTATEFALLAFMMDNPGRVLSRRRLLAAVGCHAAGDRAADVYVAQLRAKLGPQQAIRTVRGAGYVLDRVPGGPDREQPDGRATIGGAAVPMSGATLRM